MSGKLLVIWDKSHGRKENISTKEYLKNNFIDHIKHDFFKDIDVIDEASEILEDLNLTDKIDYSVYNGIVLLLKLDWKHFNGRYNGLELVRQFRVNRFLHPVFLFSDTPKKEIYEEKSQLIPLLKTPGTYLIDADTFELDLKNSKQPHSLSNQLLDDILYYANSKAGIIKNIIHEYRNKLITVVNDYRKKSIEDQQKEELKIFRKIQELIVSIVGTENQSKLDEIFNKTKEEIIKAESKPEKILDNYESEILNLNGDVYEKDNKYEVDWSVLFIDDDKRIREVTKQFFTQCGITCHLAANGIEGVEILEEDLKGELEDKPNKITAVICDYRFMNEDGEWDDLQGYDIIENIYDSLPNKLSFFMLTSKRGAIIENAKKGSKIKVSWYVKSDVLKNIESFNVFCQDVVKQAQLTYDSQFYMPAVPTWGQKAGLKAEFPLEHYYKQFRNSGKYEELEDEIAQLSLRFIDEAIHIMDDPMTNNKSEQFHILEDSCIDMDFEPSAKMKTGDLETEWSIFRDRMIARRVALVLKKYESWCDDDISSILLSKKLGGVKTRWFFSDTICLSSNIEKNFGYYLLVEEVAWLTKHYNYSATFLNDKIKGALRKLFAKPIEVAWDLFKTDREKKMRFVSAYPMLFPKYIDPANANEVRELFKGIHEVGNLGGVYVGVKKDFEKGLASFSKNKSNAEFLDRVGLQVTEKV